MTPQATTHPATDVRAMFERIAPHYDSANRLMSVGIDVLWRRHALKPLLAGLGDTPTVLDLGAGTLDGAREIARRKPGAVIAAVDFARQMLEVGRSKLDGTPRGGGHIGTHAADGHQLPYATGAFDAAFSAFCVRNLSNLPVALAELRRVVRPGGIVVVLEFFRPARKRLFFDRVYNARVLPLIGWAVTGDRAAYRYLPDSIDRFLTRPAFEESLRAAGFTRARGEDLFPGKVASCVVAQ